MSATLLCPQHHPLYRRTNRNHNKATNWMTFCFSHILQRSSYKRFRVNVINKLLSINDTINLFFAAFTQELSKITMPIVFNEPLSFLQRMSEYMEHTHLIHKACTLSDSIDRMQVNKTDGIH